MQVLRIRNSEDRGQDTPVKQEHRWDRKPRPEKGGLPPTRKGRNWGENCDASGGGETTEEQLLQVTVFSLMCGQAMH
jgi:hypothetical protein